jgi:hypothetical protein
MQPPRVAPFVQSASGRRYSLTRNFAVTRSVARPVESRARAIGLPFATVPVQDAIPEVSEHE